MPQPNVSKKWRVSNVSRKRARTTTSDDDSAQALSECRASGSRDSTMESGEKTKKKETNNSRALGELKQMMKKSENEKAKLERKLNGKKEQLKQNQQKIIIQERTLEKIKKEKLRLKKGNEKLEKEKQELETSMKKWKKKMENYRTKLTETELEKTQFQSQIALLEQRAGNSKPTQVEGEAGPTGGNLFQDMMDNFRELAETQLQCVVCSELFVDAVSINCGHTFCDYCINEWRKKKNNCPVCRTNIRSANPVKVLDEYSDKIFEQFVLEGAKKTRATLKEERAKLKAESVRPRRVNQIYNLDDDSDNSLDSDNTLEIRFDSGHDFDSDFSDEIVRFNSRFSDDSDNNTVRDSDSPPFPFRNLWDSLNVDTDSSDEDFSVRRWTRNNRTVFSDTSSSSSSSSSSTSAQASDSSDSD